MPHTKKRPGAAKRVRPTRDTWLAVLQRANHHCEWNEGGEACGLREDGIDPVGGGTVKLTADHKRPHSVDPGTDPNDPAQWQALCGRHQVIKKNYWDSGTGKLNAYAVMQAASRSEKWAVFVFLLEHFGYRIDEEGEIVKRGS